MSSITPTIGIPAAESKRARPALGLLLLAFIFPWFTGCETEVNVKDTSRTFRTVVIDAGHGGHDTGAHSRWGGMEKTATLDTALRLEPKLRAAGFHTVMTRSSDVFIPLGGRTSISNRQDNTIFVSVHFNDAPNRTAHGVETYWRSRPSRKIAERIQDSVCSLPGVLSRGVKTANYWVLRHNEYPAVLVEGGFISNPGEGARCATPAYHEALAGAIANAIIGFRGPLGPAEPASRGAAVPTTASAPPVENPAPTVVTPTSAPAPIPATNPGSASVPKPSGKPIQTPNGPVIPATR